MAIVIKATDRKYVLKWTGRDYRDQAGHVWKFDQTGMRIGNPVHGSFLDWQADVPIERKPA